MGRDTFLLSAGGFTGGAVCAGHPFGAENRPEAERRVRRDHGDDPVGGLPAAESGGECAVYGYILPAVYPDGAGSCAVCAGCGVGKGADRLCLPLRRGDTSGMPDQDDGADCADCGRRGLADDDETCSGAGFRCAVRRYDDRGNVSGQELYAEQCAGSGGLRPAAYAHHPLGDDVHSDGRQSLWRGDGRLRHHMGNDGRRRDA